MIYYVVKFVSNNIYLRGKNKIVIISSALWLTYTKTVQKVLFYCLSSCKIRHKLFPRLSEDIYCKNTTSITTVCKRKAVIKMKLKLHFFCNPCPVPSQSGVSVDKKSNRLQSTLQVRFGVLNTIIYM